MTSSRDDDNKKIMVPDWAAIDRAHAVAAALVTAAGMLAAAPVIWWLAS